MATQIRERDLLTEMNPTLVQTIDRPQETSVVSPSGIPVQVPSTAKSTSQPKSDHQGRWFDLRIPRSALVGCVRQLLMVHDLLFGLPATERDRINSHIIRARHDRYISFYR